MKDDCANEDSVSMELIREAFLYRNRFVGQTIVFKVDFPVCETAAFPYLMKDIALLSTMGVRVVIVPGVSEYIDRVLAEHKIKTRFAEGERVTSAEAMPYVEMAAFHAATRFMTALSAGRVDAVIGNFVRARGRGVVGGLDYANTGVVDKIYTDAIKRALDGGMTAIIPCIGWSPVGKSYNVPSNEIAVAACRSLMAVKMVIVSAGHPLYAPGSECPDGIEKSASGEILRLTPDEAREIKAFNEKDAPVNRDKQKTCVTLALALEALEAGAERVHIVNGGEEGVVLRELFSNLGAGTMIYTGEYDAIRGIKTRDIPDMLRLMEPLMQKGVLLRRTAEDIRRMQDDFVVFAVDGAIHACAALHARGEGQAEIAALAADPTYSGTGAGRRLVRYLIEKAGRHGFRRVFALTTSTGDWFEKLGFKEVPVESLPAEKLKIYDKKRASKVVALDI